MTNWVAFFESRKVKGVFVTREVEAKTKGIAINKAVAVTPKGYALRKVEGK